MAQQKFITVMDVAEIFGCTPAAIRMKLKQGVIPRSLTYKIGSRVFFDKKELRKWIEANRRKDAE